jgi:hypothetical protein
MVNNTLFISGLFPAGGDASAAFFEQVIEYEVGKQAALHHGDGDGDVVEKGRKSQLLSPNGLNGVQGTEDHGHCGRCPI